MRLARLVVAGLALGAAIGFLGALCRPRSVHPAIFAAAAGMVGVSGSLRPATAAPDSAGTQVTSDVVTPRRPPPTIAPSPGVPALTGTGGAC
jgi:hypothetical protein